MSLTGQARESGEQVAIRYSLLVTLCVALATCRPEPTELDQRAYIAIRSRIVEALFDIGCIVSQLGCTVASQVSAVIMPSSASHHQSLNLHLCALLQRVINLSTLCSQLSCAIHSLNSFSNQPLLGWV